MQIVGRAIHANDQLTIELVGQQLGMRGQVATVQELLTRVRQAQYRLATQERVVRAELTEAMRSAATIVQASGSEELARQADALIAAARSQLHRIDLAREGLRQGESEVLERSIELDDRAGSLRGDLRRTRQTKKDLFGQMAVAEVLVGSRLAAWSGPFDGMSGFVLGGVFNVCPVDQPMSYSDNWHAPRWGGGFHLHQGIDIFAPIGTPIRAPFDGLAVTADNWLGGIAVKVYGDAGYVYNAHLSGYGQLGQVEAGTIIGYVGETGNASGPHDHFEFHPGGGDAVNPFGMLNAAC
jgi:murein DD-endopeptidase MepM/ murein hydrolase activator NlpD